jgi:glycosyltransferase involved in cell wall biosynthesis
MPVGNPPSVAIISRTKDRVILLERCIQTVLAQTTDDWIHVIVNDAGSRAPVDALVLKYQGAYRGRLKVIHNEDSRGMEAASNIGVNSCSSKYVVILDDDDSWAPTFLEEMISALASSNWPETRGIFCHTQIVYEEIRGDKVVETGRGDFNQWINSIELIRLFAWNRFTPVCFLFERAALDEVGLFDETLPVIGDWEFNIRFLSKYDIDVYPKTLAFWHQRPSAQGIYGNSVHHGHDLHMLYRARLGNRWLRESLRRGTTDFGELFTMSLMIEHDLTLRDELVRWKARLIHSTPYRFYSRLRGLLRGWWK